MTNKEIADRLRNAVGNKSFAAVEYIISELDPPKVDRSLRGWVVVERSHGEQFVRWAREDGLYVTTFGNSKECSWDDLERFGWTVRKLTLEDIGYKVRRWDEWTIEEQHAAPREAYVRLICDYAIDTALKEIPND